jgi:hypothetical protein
MKTLAISVLVLIVLVSSVASTSAKEWNGIVPLKSTRTDVERLLGRGSDNVYHYGKLIVRIEYAQFPCGHKSPPGWPQPPPGWNVPRDTVVAIDITMGKHTVPLKSVPYDLSKFQKVRGDSDRPQHFYYTDDAHGFAISVFEYDAHNHVVTNFLYLPTANDEKLFRCKD